MKKKSFHIAINEPCAESWQNMQQNANGKFCMHCSKTVIDFTQQTSYEIKSYFQQNIENTCGRFTKQQLNETYTIYEASKFDHYKFVASLALGLLTLDTLNAFSIDGKDFKNEKDSVQIVSIIKENEKDSINHQTQIKISQNKNITFTGTVVDSTTSEPLVGVNITMKHTTIGCVTDANGKFSITVPPEDTINFVASYTWYENKIITVSNPNESLSINLSLSLNKNFNPYEVGMIGVKHIRMKSRKYKRQHKH